MVTINWIMQWICRGYTGELGKRLIQYGRCFLGLTIVINGIGLLDYFETLISVVWSKPLAAPPIKHGYDVRCNSKSDVVLKSDTINIATIE